MSDPIAYMPPDGLFHHITIGGQPVARSVAGALGRLELAVAADADLRADVDFLRVRINAVEGERDDLYAAIGRAITELRKSST